MDISTSLMLLLVILCMSVCCAQEWVEHGLYEYYFGTNHRNWQSARSHCLEMNSDLASVTGRDESEFLNITLSTLRESGHWLGLYRLRSDICPCVTLPDGHTVSPRTNEECEARAEAFTCCECRDKWTWTDGTPMNYMNWMPNEPTGYAQCGRIDSPAAAQRPGYPNITIFAWYDVACEEQFRYICKRASGSTTILPYITTTESKHRIGSSKSTNEDRRPGELLLGLFLGLSMVTNLILSFVLFSTCIKHKRQTESSVYSQPTVSYQEETSPYTSITSSYMNQEHGPRSSRYEIPAPEASTVYGVGGEYEVMENNSN